VGALNSKDAYSDLCIDVFKTIKHSVYDTNIYAVLKLPYILLFQVHFIGPLINYQKPHSNLNVLKIVYSVISSYVLYIIYFIT